MNTAYTFYFLCVFLLGIVYPRFYRMDLLEVWGLGFKYTFIPCILFWVFFFLFYHVKRYSIWTSCPLKKGEENPKGIGLYIVVLIGALFFGAAGSMGLSGPLFLINTHTGIQTMHTNYAVIQYKGVDEDKAQLKHYFNIRDDKGEEISIFVDQHTFKEYHMGDRFPIGYYKKGSLGVRYSIDEIK
ncbi:MAG: hypothetical protein JW827_10495 [Spirochaetes bacterium]|nr:hypothetical protein [Spirochaetota bacterium]